MPERNGTSGSNAGQHRPPARQRLLSSLRKLWTETKTHIVGPTPTSLPPDRKDRDACRGVNNGRTVLTIQTKSKEEEEEEEEGVMRRRRERERSSCSSGVRAPITLRLSLLGPPRRSSLESWSASKSKDFTEIKQLLELVCKGTVEEKLSSSRALWRLGRIPENSVGIISMEGLSAVLHLATSQELAAEHRENAAGILRQLARLPSNRVALWDAGGASALLLLLRVSDASAIQRNNALNALVDLAKVSVHRRRMFETDGAGPIVALLREGTNYQKERAARVIWLLARERQNQRSIAAEEAAIPSLLELLKSGRGKQTENAVGALWYLAFSTERAVAIIASGAVPLLVALVDRGTEGEKVNAAGALWRLLSGGRAEGRRAIKAAGAIPPLVRLISPLCVHGDNTQETQQLCKEMSSALQVGCALKALWVLCEHDQQTAAEVITAIRECGGGSLSWLIDQKMERLKALATDLIRLIVEATPEGPKEEVCLLSCVSPKTLPAEIHVHIDFQE